MRWDWFEREREGHKDRDTQTHRQRETDRDRGWYLFVEWSIWREESWDRCVVWWFEVTIGEDAWSYRVNYWECVREKEKDWQLVKMRWGWEEKDVSHYCLSSRLASIWNRNRILMRVWIWMSIVSSNHKSHHLYLLPSLLPHFIQVSPPSFPS